MTCEPAIYALIAIPTLLGLGLLWVGMTGPKE